MMSSVASQRGVSLDCSLLHLLVKMPVQGTAAADGLLESG